MCLLTEVVFAIRSFSYVVRIEPYRASCAGYPTVAIPAHLCFKSRLTSPYLNPKYETFDQKQQQ